MAGMGHRMEKARTHCPECEQRLHPQEIEALLGGRKLDCWYCEAPLKAGVTRWTAFITSCLVGLVPLVELLVRRDSTPWFGLVFATVVAATVHVSPPGLIQGAPWVRIVNRKAPTLDE